MIVISINWSFFNIQLKLFWLILKLFDYFEFMHKLLTYLNRFRPYILIYYWPSETLELYQTVKRLINHFLVSFLCILRDSVLLLQVLERSRTYLTAEFNYIFTKFFLKFKFHLYLNNQQIPLLNTWWSVSAIMKIFQLRIFGNFNLLLYRIFKDLRCIVLLACRIWLHQYIILLF